MKKSNEQVIDTMAIEVRLIELRIKTGKQFKCENKVIKKVVNLVEEGKLKEINYDGNTIKVTDDIDTLASVIFIYFIDNSVRDYIDRLADGYKAICICCGREFIQHNLEGHDLCSEKCMKAFF